MTDPVIRGNSLYTVVDGPSWTEAEVNAQKVGGHLVTIESHEEDLFLVDKIYGIPEHQPNGGDATSPRNVYFIGLSNESLGRDTSWSSGSTSPYRFYDVSYSDTTQFNPGVFVVSSNHEGETGHWVSVDNDSSFYKNWGWNHFGLAETPIVVRGDSAYAIVQGPTWEEAEANAQKLGGHLVTINDTAENQWLSQTFSDAGRSSLSLGAPIQIPGNAFALWIGATDKTNEGSWTNSTGQSLAYTNWSSSEPNNVGWYDSNGEDYAGIRQDGTWFDSGANAPYSDMAFSGIAEIKLTGTTTPTDDGKPPAAPTLTKVAALSTDTASASGLEGLNLDVGGAANVQAPVTLKSTSDASTVEGNVKSDAHATEVLGISTSTLHSASDLSVGSALQSIVSGGSCQERCHLLEAFYASLTKATWRLVCSVANGSLIHTKSGCFQQRIDLLQRFKFARRACS